MSYRFIPLILIMPLAACSLWDDYTPQKNEVPEAWKTGAANAKWPDATWWQNFKSPALDSQIEEAQKANYDIQAAIARVRQADAQVRISGAALLPSVDASADASRDRTAAGRVSSTGISGKPKYGSSYNATLNASYELDFWGKNWSAEESAKALASASRFDQQTLRLTIMSSVATNYFDILATQERLQVARDDTANANLVLESVRKRFAQGIVSELDVAQQENVAQLQATSSPPLEQRLRQDLDAQAILLGKLPESIEAPQEKFADIALPEVSAGLPSELLARRPDVQSAEAQLISANANIINARAQYFPNISLTAQGGYASSQLGKLFRPDSQLWSIGGSLLQPIFEGGLLDAQVDLAKGRYDEALQNYRKTVATAFADVEDALVAAQQAQLQEEAQKAAVQTAQKAYELSQQQLAGGVVDITSVLATQRTLFSSQDALVQVHLGHLQAIVTLYKVLGGGWQAASDRASVSAVSEPTAAPDAPAPDVTVQQAAPEVLATPDAAPVAAPVSDLPPASLLTPLWTAKGEHDAGQ